MVRDARLPGNRRAKIFHASGRTSFSVRPGPSSRPDEHTPDVRTAAINALSRGLCVFPPAENGTKAPDGRWGEYQTSRSTIDDIRRWYGASGPPKRTGLGVICGAVSGNLEAFEFDRQGSAYEPFKEAARGLGMGDLIDRLEAGYLERSPSGGIHWLYRCEAVSENTKLAEYESDKINPATNKPIPKALIETRGEGGYIVTAPTNGRVHPTGGAYVLISGGFGSIPTITAEERAELWSLARTFDEMPPEEDACEPREAAGRASQGQSDWDVLPGTDYGERTTWDEILPKHGWQRAYESRGVVHWRRPGKSVGVSATTNYAETDLLKVFTTSSDFAAGKTYTKFAAYAVLEHGGNFPLAFRALADLRYGKRKPKPEGAQPPPPPAGGDAEDAYAAATDAELGIIGGDEVEPENPEWLWEHRFFANKINLVAGGGGDGKTTLLLTVAAVKTRGGAFPDGSPSGAPGTALVLAAEDGPADTLLPRLIAAGADVSRVKFLKPQVTIPKKGNRPAMVDPVTLQNLAYWRTVFKRYRPAMLIIDPVPAYMGRGVNDHRNADVQAVMNRFSDLATEFRVCVGAITHTGKAKDFKMVHRVLGSVAYTNCARAVHVTVCDPDDPATRYLAREKCNLDEPRDALAYKLVSAEFTWKGKTFKTSRAEIASETVKIDVNALAAEDGKPRPKPGPAPDHTTKVAKWLFDFLASRIGWTRASDVRSAAGQAGLIGEQREIEGKLKWSNLTALYRAKDEIPRLPDPQAGHEVGEEKFDGWPHWKLINPAETPY
jgi:hypothetical protein